MADAKAQVSSYQKNPNFKRILLELTWNIQPKYQKLTETTQLPFPVKCHNAPPHKRREQRSISRCCQTQTVGL